ncbi:hypothetical protein [Tropicimonas sp.]|uniref:hypothetical protein n=1 Tax=Tropicimonas sp. TaxID=2067044 RepID=UPI003A875FF1
MKTGVGTVVVLVLGLAVPAAADPAFGVGISLVLDRGKRVDGGIAFRVFSDDRPYDIVASVGIDFLFRSKRIRPTIGAAYLDRRAFVGLDLGYDFQMEALDIGISAGVTETDQPARKRPAKPSTPAAAPAPRPATPVPAAPDPVVTPVSPPTPGQPAPPPETPPPAQEPGPDPQEPDPDPPEGGGLI